MKRFKGISLFANVGVAETYLEEIGIDIVLANELLSERADFYRHLYPNVEMVTGDITNNEFRENIIYKARDNAVDFLMATPPCQGMSLAGKMDELDERNQLIYYAVEAILQILPKYALIENVPQQLTTKIKVQGEDMLIPEYFKKVLGDSYDFASKSLVSAKQYQVPQMRKRNITLLSRKDMKYKWEMPPAIEPEITLKDVLWDLPSLDPLLTEGMEETIKLFPSYEEKRLNGLEVSKWHYPPRHSKKLVMCMMRTPSGKTAFDNDFYYPKKANGERVNGHYNTYRRYDWNKPSRTITQNSGVISSLCCVHPGKLIISSKHNEDCIYSDARCLSIYELLLVSSLPKNWDIPEWASEKFIRSVIGEGIPPLLIKNICKELIEHV